MVHRQLLNQLRVGLFNHSFEQLPFFDTISLNPYCSSNRSTYERFTGPVGYNFIVGFASLYRSPYYYVEGYSSFPLQPLTYSSESLCTSGCIPFNSYTFISLNFSHSTKGYLRYYPLVFRDDFDFSPLSIKFNLSLYF